MFIRSINANRTQPHPAILDAAYRLAMLGLQSDRYTEDMDYRDAIDAILAILPPAVPSHSL